MTRPGFTPRATPRSRWRRHLLVLLLTPLLASVLVVLVLRWVEPPGSAFMWLSRLDADAARRTPVVDYRWRDWQALSPQLPIALVAAEDQRFPQHLGFDVDAIRSALAESAGRGRGASTISQQVAKNLFLWPGRSWLRKGMEVWFTALIEATWPKRRILEVYCNIAEFGPGVYGAEAAAQRYFGKSAAQLSLTEAAQLAAVLPSPKRWSVRDPAPAQRSRARWIVRQVRQLGGPEYLRGLD